LFYSVIISYAASSKLQHLPAAYFSYFVFRRTWILLVNVVFHSLPLNPIRYRHKAKTTLIHIFVWINCFNAYSYYPFYQSES